MQLDPYVEAVQRQLAAAAETGGNETRALAAQLAAALESAVRLALQDALASAVAEITSGSGLGRTPPGEVGILSSWSPPATDSPDQADPELLPAPIRSMRNKAQWTRINLRLPARLKTRIEAAATATGLSVNAWLVRVVVLAAGGPEVTRETSASPTTVSTTGDGLASLRREADSFFFH